MKLSGKVEFGFVSEPFLARIERQIPDGTFELQNISAPGGAVIVARVGDAALSAVSAVTFGEEFNYLTPGDILRLNPASQEMRVLYRRNSRHNSLFFTERCNSRCLMCSQPPRDVDDSYLVDDLLRIIPWMDPATSELGITGGEPTLLFDGLIDVLEATKSFLPRTSIHMLTNGRRLSHLHLAEQIGEVRHHDLMLGVPIYSDLPAAHDFVVQAAGAFDQTIFGLLNLARVGVPVEIRIVIHRHTFDRLPQFARFVARNLPFASQVVLMGLEMTGYTRSNLDALWIDPADYQDELASAVEILDSVGIRVKIYNHQLCVLRPELHRFAMRSISDWKNIFMPECSGCSRQSDCGGFFASAKLRYSKQIRAFIPAVVAG